MTIATNFAVSFVEIVCSISLSELLQVVPHFSVLKLSNLGSGLQFFFNVVFYNKVCHRYIIRKCQFGIFESLNMRFMLFYYVKLVRVRSSNQKIATNRFSFAF